MDINAVLKFLHDVFDSIAVDIGKSIVAGLIVSALAVAVRIFVRMVREGISLAQSIKIDLSKLRLPRSSGPRAGGSDSSVQSNSAIFVLTRALFFITVVSFIAAYPTAGLWRVITSDRWLAAAFGPSGIWIVFAIAFLITSALSVTTPIKYVFGVFIGPILLLPLIEFVTVALAALTIQFLHYLYDLPFLHVFAEHYAERSASNWFIPMLNGIPLLLFHLLAVVILWIVARVSLQFCARSYPLPWRVGDRNFQQNLGGFVFLLQIVGSVTLYAFSFQPDYPPLLKFNPFGH